MYYTCKNNNATKKKKKIHRKLNTSKSRHLSLQWKKKNAPYDISTTKIEDINDILKSVINWLLRSCVPNNMGSAVQLLIDTEVKLKFFKPNLI